MAKFQINRHSNKKFVRELHGPLKVKKKCDYLLQKLKAYTKSFVALVDLLGKFIKSILDSIDRKNCLKLFF